MSSDKALACVGDKGEYEAPGYIITDAEFAVWTDSADDGAKTWLLMDRDTAGELCPDAAQDREYWRVGVERDAEAAARLDNYVPIASLVARRCSATPLCWASTLRPLPE